MTALIRSAPEAPTPLADAWSALRDYLARKSRDLNDEVSSYPTPIARCDEQLTKLLAQRARAVRALRLADEASAAATGASLTAEGLQRLAQWLELPEGDDDDDVEHALRRRLAEALADYEASASTSSCFCSTSGKSCGARPLR